MNTEVTEIEEPIIMNVSAYSNIAQKLNFLALAIKDQKDAESQDIYIECYTETRKVDDKEQELKIIRFSTDMYLWTEIHPYDKLTGDLLPQNISVNLYDFYNIIDSCKDDIIAFWIDDTSNELVLSSFYNDLREYDELEVRVKINKKGFPLRALDNMQEGNTPVASFELNQVSLHYILLMNMEHNTDGVNIVFENRRMTIQSDYHGVKTILMIREYEKQIFFKNTTVFIPFYVLNLMSGTGEVNPIKFEVYEDLIKVETTDYNFMYKIEDKKEAFTISADNFEDYMVVDSKNMESVIKLLNKVNKPAPISTVKFEKISKTSAEMSAEYEGRYTVITRIDLAMLSDDIISMDSDIVQIMFNNIGIDAIKMDYNPENHNLIHTKYENQLMEKEILYDHEEFNAFRKKTFEKAYKVGELKKIRD